RHIPQRIKDLVYKRDGGRCSFVSKNGRRCNSTWNLQYDHIIPYARGGDNSPENLRLLCARHNRLMAEREYGKAHIDNILNNNSAPGIKA
ncbi:MAG: HNH endonuclease signature motif containing protein, partial [Candidatus Krumholzibacteriales bacterium]